MNYTREQINRLICQYQPAIVYRGKVYELQHPPLLADTVLRLEIYPFEYVNAPLDECRMMLRPVGSLTDVELQELAGVMYDSAARCEIVQLYSTDKLAIAFEYATANDSSCHDWYPLNEMAPIKAADYLFSKHINFLNLPAEICTEQITTV